MIQYVKVDGTNVDLNTVDHDVSITVGRRDLTTTFAPSDPTSFATSAPMPRPEPVMTMERLASGFAMMCSLFPAA